MLGTRPVKTEEWSKQRKRSKKRRGRLSYQSGAHGSGKEHRQFETILAKMLVGAMEMRRNAPAFPGMLGRARGRFAGSSKASDISA